jgi:flagellar basal body P-ring formation protein FlgA
MFSFFFLFISLFSFGQTDNFKDEVQTYLKQNLKQYERFEFEILQSPSKAEKIVIDDSTPLNISGGLASISVTAIDKENRTSQAYITIKVKLFQKVVVAKSEIRMKEGINPGNLELKTLDVTMIKGVPLTKPEDALYNCARTKIAAGRIITDELMDRMAVVKSGDKVNVNSVNGNVVVTTYAIAKQDGRIGDIIRIITLGNKQFKAKVVDANNVIIIE